MKKRIVCTLCTLLLCMSLLPAPIAAALDPAVPCSLTLSYSRGDTAFPGLEVTIYRVAKAYHTGDFHLTDDFADSGVNIHNVTSQQEWRDIADTLSSLAAAAQLSPCRSEVTGADGTVVFSGLETGLYLVEQATASQGGDTFLFQRSMIYLPTPVDGGYQYDMTAKPKPGQPPSSTEYRVLKLWKDSGVSTHRPDSVTVDILKDGELQDSVILSDRNNWSHVWTVPDDGGVWSVSERDVPSGYQALTSTRDTTFVITNTRRTPTPDDPDIPSGPDIPVDPNIPNPVIPDNPDSPSPGTPGNPDTPDSVPPGVPKTGDTAPLAFYTMTTCISGLLLMILGVGSIRSKRHEENR